MMPDPVFRFVAEMFAVQLNQLAALLVNLGEPADDATAQARELVACALVP